MSTITEELNKIRNAIYGEEVRGSIISAIEKAYNSAISSAATVSGLSTELADAKTGLNGTVYQSVGEAIRNQLSDMRSIVGFSTTQQTQGLKLEQGTIKTNGGDSSDDTRVRTPRIDEDAYIVFRNIAPHEIHVSVAEGFKVNVHEYTSNPTVPNHTKNIGFKTGSFDMAIVQGYYYRVVIAKTDDSDITPSEAAGKVTITYNLRTDRTLNKSHECADAYATGYAIESLEHLICKDMSTIDIGSLVWEQGSYSSAGGLINTNYRCRSATLKTYDCDFFKLTITDGYSIRVYEYDGDTASQNTFVSRSDNFFVGSSTISVTPGHTYRLVIRAVATGQLISPDTLPENCVAAVGFRKISTDPVTYNMIKMLAENGQNLDSIEWVQGTMSTSTGHSSDSETRVRTRHAISENSLRYLYVFCPEGWKISYRRYLQNDAYTYVSSGLFATGMQLIENNGPYAYYFVLGRTDDAAITPSDVPDLSVVPVYYPSWHKLACGKSIGAFTTARCNKTYVDQLVAVAQTYYDHRNDTTGTDYDMTYGYSSILRYTGQTREIDCSTFVALVLGGYNYTSTSYYTKTYGSPDDYTKNGDYAWSINPREFNVINNLTNTEDTPVTTAGQLAQWFISQGRRVPIDSKLANLEPGDIVFFARNNENGNPAQPSRFMRINHVAICTGKRPTTSSDPWTRDRFPYYHELTEVTAKTPCVRKSYAELSWDDPTALSQNNYYTMVLICRPDLGSI